MTIERWTNGSLKDLELHEFYTEDLQDCIRLVATGNPVGYMGGTEEVGRVLDRADVESLRNWLSAWLETPS